MKICRICGQEVEKLTHEHIPPKAFGNTGRGYLLGSDENGNDWITDIIQGKNDYKNSAKIDYKKLYMQNGQTKKTICSACNSKAGEKLVNDFVKVAKIIEKSFIQKLPEGCDYISVNIEELGENYCKIYMNFLKHIIFQFLCIQPNENFYIQDLRDLYNGKNYDRFALEIEMSDFYSHNIHSSMMSGSVKTSMCQHVETISYGHIKTSLKRFSIIGKGGLVSIENNLTYKINEFDNKLDVFTYSMVDPILYFKVKKNTEQDPLAYEKFSF